MGPSTECPHGEGWGWHCSLRAVGAGPRLYAAEKGGPSVGRDGGAPWNLLLPLSPSPPTTEAAVGLGAAWSAPRSSRSPHRKGRRGRWTRLSEGPAHKPAPFSGFELSSPSSPVPSSGSGPAHPTGIGGLPVGAAGSPPLRDWRGFDCLFSASHPPTSSCLDSHHPSRGV